MSKENVDAWRRAVDAYNHGDTEGAVGIYDPGVEWRPAVQGCSAETQPSTAAAGVKEFYGALARAACRSGSRSWKLALTSAIGHCSWGVSTDAGRRAVPKEHARRLLYLVDFRNGKVTRVVYYLDHRESPPKPPGCRSRRCRRRTWSASPAYDAFNRRDWDAFVALMDDEIEGSNRAWSAGRAATTML